MSWQHIVVIVLHALSGLLAVRAIGEPREPITPGLAVWSIVYVSILIALVVTG